ncbi:MAG: zf-HC2 domain-containing protein, partial [Planctomycetota bacterium]|nr:zf-HC2 domain-containing protein [Planctomycetota bacterium]
MKCKKAIELIPALSLGDLDVEAKRSLENHLADCLSCRKEADQELGVISELSSLPVIETAQARRDRTVEAMSQEHSERIERILLQPRKGSGRIRIWGAAAAG